MESKLPGIIVTGASGFIGSHFLNVAADNYRLFCIARRSQKETQIPSHENIRWIQADIGKWDTLREAVRRIKEQGGADYVLHLAGYYDFSNKDNPEYERTNVTGTRNVLKLAKLIGTKRFLFSSSLAACKFPPSGQVINEKSAPDGTFPYARSKRFGEEMLREHSEWFPCTIIRLAAIFSDFCQYPPVYVFLKTWLAQKWNSRILGGKGQSAVTYLHINDLNKLFFRIIERSNSLPRICTFNASPTGYTTHLDLYTTAVRYYYGKEIKPFHMPKLLAWPGVAAGQFIGALIGKPPFESLWMLKYVDKILNVDSSFTQKELDWRPTPRYEILRRLLFLIENMKNRAEVWVQLNEAALLRVAERPHLIIHDILTEIRDDIVNEVVMYILAPENQSRFPNYAKLEENTLHWYITLVYQLITTVVRTRDRALMLDYAQTIAHRRYAEGFDVEEVCLALKSTEKIIREKLLLRPELKNKEQLVYDNVDITFQITVDEIEDSFDMLKDKSPELLKKLKKSKPSADIRDLERLVHELEEF